MKNKKDELTARIQFVVGFSPHQKKGKKSISFGMSPGVKKNIKSVTTVVSPSTLLLAAVAFGFCPAGAVASACCFPVAPGTLVNNSQCTFELGTPSPCHLSNFSHGTGNLWKQLQRCMHVDRESMMLLLIFYLIAAPVGI